MSEGWSPADRRGRMRRAEIVESVASEGGTWTVTVQGTAAELGELAQGARVGILLLGLAPEARTGAPSTGLEALGDARRPVDLPPGARWLETPVRCPTFACGEAVSVLSATEGPFDDEGVWCSPGDVWRCDGAEPHHGSVLVRSLESGSTATLGPVEDCDLDELVRSWISHLVLHRSALGPSLLRGLSGRLEVPHGR